MKNYRRKKKRSVTRRKPQHVIEGVIQVSRRGEGFVETAEGNFRIPRKGVGPAMNGDTVALVRTHAFGPGYKAYVHAVLDRAVTTIVGRYETDGVLRVVVPLDERIQHDFFLDPQDRSPDLLKVQDEDVVCARIVHYPTRKSAGIATIEKRIGSGDDQDLAVDQIIASYGFCTQFPEAVLQEARSLSLGDDKPEPDRVDLTDLLVVTIDPEDAKDFDDALSCEVIDDNTWRLGVHIADVSHFVRPGSSLDIEARRRSTSVYLVDRVIPMLPEELSCELCSLKPDEDRLAFSVFMDITNEGTIEAYEFLKTKIHSARRFTYEEVDHLLPARPEQDACQEELGAQACFQSEQGAYQEDLSVQTYSAETESHTRSEGKTTTPQISPAINEMLTYLDLIACLRQKVRRKRGSLDFETTESKVVLDEAGVPVGVKIRKRTRATSLVEEAMLMANECVAHYLDTHEQPAAFRVHDRPDDDGLQEVVNLIAEFGAEWDLKDATSLVAGVVAGVPQALQRVLDLARGRSEEYLVHNTVLRSMKRAQYAPCDTGHYGLGTHEYCHFTSPIRRYPDLIVHRALAGELSDHDVSQLSLICQHASDQERAADSAASESQRVKLVEYMGNFLGEVFEGVITSVQPYGVFVRLDKTTAWGLVPVKYFGDEWFEYNEERSSFEGEMSGLILRAGNRVWVTIKSVDVSAGHITCELHERTFDGL